eukprot:Nitzschia sp. Nitz4//scaffold106_size73319//1105//2763//NITZ4_005724-RA/size73319-processed-gene-0.32-mRNA-1//1//CDS//3329532484//1502//frame0
MPRPKLNVVSHPSNRNHIGEGNTIVMFCFPSETKEWETNEMSPMEIQQYGKQHAAEVSRIRELITEGTMTTSLQDGDDETVLANLESLVQFVSSETSKEDGAILVSSGTLEQVMGLLRKGVVETMAKVEIPRTALHFVSLLTESASDALKNDHLLPSLTTVHQIMSMYGEDSLLAQFGCSFLRSMSNPLLQELVAAESPVCLMTAMKRHPENALVQEHGNAALYNLLPVCHEESLKAESLGDHPLPAIVLRGMEQHGKVLAVQQYGLLVLDRVCQMDQELVEIVLAEGALNVVLGDHFFPMALEDDCLAQLLCQFLRDLSRQTSQDIRRAMAVKGGLQAVVRLMDCHADAINVQDPAMACLRNLCVHPDNREEALKEESLVSTILWRMNRFWEDAAICAYACDVLGRLVCTPVSEDPSRTTSSASPSAKECVMGHPLGLAVALRAMKTHRDHGGVQDRAVFFLLSVCEGNVAGVNKLAGHWTQDDEASQKDLRMFLRETRVPPRGVDRLKELIRIVESGLDPQFMVKSQDQPESGGRIRSYFAGRWPLGTAS